MLWISGRKILKLLHSHDGAVVLRLLGGGAQVRDHDGVLHMGAGGSRDVGHIAFHNAGIQRAESLKPILHDGNFMENIYIDSTRKYVKEILERRDQYEREWKWEKLK